MIKGNRELLSQAIANLVDNAIKYATPSEGAPAEIVLSARPQGARPRRRRDRRPRTVALMLRQLDGNVS